MTALFSESGLAAIRGLARRESVLVFDLDGTLAPIVPRPSDALVPLATAARLQALCRRWPVAVITGRAVQDATRRLGFTPMYLFGNHGAERLGTGSSEPLTWELDACRDLLRRNASVLLARRIRVEDKGLSLALHYRFAADPPSARLWLDSLSARMDAGVRASHGHCVLNITPDGARDKGDALLEIMRESGASQALVVGDDVNDESAFVKAPRGSVSVRIAPGSTPTGARFRLAHQSLVDPLLALLLGLKR